MGIRDIKVPENIQTFSLGTAIETGTGKPLDQDLQSGSILKVLASAPLFFDQKIKNNYQKGFRYQIIHSAPSPDFIIIEKSPSGMKQFFSFHITEDAPEPETQITPEIQPAEAPQLIEPTKTQTPEAPQNIPPIPQEPVHEEITLPIENTPLEKEIPPIEEPAIEASSEEKNEGVKIDIAHTRGALADALFKSKTPLYNGKSWLQERLKVGNDVKLITPEELATLRKSYETILTEKIKETPMSTSEKLDFLKQERAMLAREFLNHYSAEINKRFSDSIATASDNQKYEALQMILDIPETHEIPPASFTQREPAKEVVAPAPKTTLDLLKKKFSQPEKRSAIIRPLQPVAMIPNNPITQNPDRVVTVGKEISLEKAKQSILEKATGRVVGDGLEQEWEKLKKLPAEPFFKPELLVFENRTNEEPITLEKYPADAQAIHGALAPTVKKMEESGKNIQTMNLGEFLEQAIKENLIS